ncbi:Calmodulin-lysine N-methyltransferase [Larimichthys crocea]|uniref:Uncharacterized protein n=1 Tax=Larimichthys crocea TaxID=215358 RepID=A0ACD3QBR8_LARCR|nr:Calmodulin-lysine N-methyltransferase [Larimichthys crocea]
MERESSSYTGTAGRNTEPASPVRKNINEDNTCVDNSHSSSRDGTCGTTDVARARWTLLRQVLRRKQVDSPEVKQVSVRRFATFDLFSRKRLLTQDPSDTSDDQWVEYRSVYFPEYSALLRDNLGPLRVNEVLNSFDNTGNVCVWPSEEVMAHYCLQKRHMFNYMKGIRQARRAECRVTAANGVMARPDKHPASNEKALRLPSSPVTMQLLNRVIAR